MLDAFGGCCVYEDPPAHSAGTYGVLGWLLAGADALSSCNSDDRTLIARVLESLPDDLYAEARQRMIEGKVHRWAGAVSGQPGGCPLRDVSTAHRPEPVEHPGLVVVGDYLFDSTLNGVLRSAQIATDVLRDQLASSLTLACFPATCQGTGDAHAEGETRPGRPGPAEPAAGHRARSTGIRARPVDGPAGSRACCAQAAPAGAALATPPIATIGRISRPFPSSTPIWRISQTSLPVATGPGTRSGPTDCCGSSDAAGWESSGSPNAATGSSNVPSP